MVECLAQTKYNYEENAELVFAVRVGRSREWDAPRTCTE
jgi:hypothetical protein